MFRGRRLAIKAALLNQTLLSGVGTFMPTRACSERGSGRGARPEGSPKHTWSGCEGSWSLCSNRQFGWEVPLCPTMSTRRRARVFPTGALRIPADGTTLPSLRNAYQEGDCGREELALLSAVPELTVL